MGRSCAHDRLWSTNGGRMSDEQVISLAWVRYEPHHVCLCAFCRDIVDDVGIIRANTEDLVERNEANILHQDCYFSLLQAKPGDDHA